MIVLDTSMWVEMLLGSSIGGIAQGYFRDAPSIIVPTMVQYELEKWTLRENRPDKAQELAALSNRLNVAPLDTAIAMLAAHLSKDHGLHATDAIIYATAQIHDAELVTCDAHFEGLPGVRYYPKSVG